MDQFQKVRFGERLATDLGTDLRRIPGGKHFTPKDHPHVVAEAVNQVLAAPDLAPDHREGPVLWPADRDVGGPGRSVGPTAWGGTGRRGPLA